MALDAARAKSLFLAASDLADPVERASYLDRECGGDAELRARVEALLRANDVSPIPEPGVADATGAFQPAHAPVTATFGDAAQTADHPGKDEHAGAVVAGKYTLVEPIGEGGMGSVWWAKQTEPVKRFVAVKLIKAGMDSKQVLARFEAERQALALMDHPNIAKVLDGGLHEHRPFFVMELVKGTPITEYCDACKLTPQQRLELFVQVCQAIQHAHQKGIIHRDIKPSNVLVALYDDKPVVKVIDFGVAKATGGALTEHTLDTGFGGIVGTPQYMSPEQATFNNLDIDTRSDVYALGVLLYELLAGSPPFSGAELKKRGLLEILRVVREEEPPRPSTKLSTSDALPSLSANRGTEPKKLTGLLRNELDWVVMKALEKDRARRYETANGFAADVLRYLSGEAVQAHPPSAGYRLKKFVRRNKGQVIAASLVLFVLVAGVIGTTFGLVQAEDKRREAEQAREREKERADGEASAKLAERRAKEDADARRKEAETNLTYSTKANDILTAVFAGLDPTAKHETVAELRDALKANLKKTAKELDGSAIGDPLTVARMQHALGDALIALDEAELAVELFSKCRTTRTARQGATHRDTLQAGQGLGRGYAQLGQPDRVVRLAEEMLKGVESELAADHPDTLACMAFLAWAYKLVERNDDATRLAERALKLTRAKLGADHQDTLDRMNNLAGCHQHAGRFEKALTLFQEVLDTRMGKLGADHPDTLTSTRNLGVCWLEARMFDKGLPLIAEALTRETARLGASHPDVLVLMQHLAMGYYDAGEPKKALPLAVQSLELHRAKLGTDHNSTLVCLNNTALVYSALGKNDDAARLYEETLAILRRKGRTDHPDMLPTLTSLGAVYWELGQRDKAVPLLEQALEFVQARSGRDHLDTLNNRDSLAKCYLEAGRPDKAVPLLEVNHQVAKAKLGADAPQTLDTLHLLAVGYGETGRGEKAVAAFADLLAVSRKRLPKGSAAVAGLLARASSDLLRFGQFSAAEPLLRECLVIREKSQPDVWSTFNTQSMLGGALLGQKKYADAEPMLVKSYEGMKAREKTIPPQANTRIPESLDRLVELFTATNKPDEAKKYRDLRAKYPPEVAPPPRVKG